MKKILIITICLTFSLVLKSQSTERIKENKHWFDDFITCKCISYSYWKKGIKIKDESVLFWNEKTPISKNNMEQLEDFISQYVNKFENNNSIINNCLKIKYEENYNRLIEKIIKTDLGLKKNKIIYP